MCVVMVAAIGEGRVTASCHPLGVWMKGGEKVEVGLPVRLVRGALVFVRTQLGDPT